jgi:hypothetical protein
MVFKPYLVLKERSLVKLENRTRKLEGGMRRVGTIYCLFLNNFLAGHRLTQIFRI